MNNDQIKASISLIVEAIASEIALEDEAKNASSKPGNGSSTTHELRERIAKARENRGNICKVQGIHLLTNFLQNINTIAAAAEANMPTRITQAPGSHYER